MSKNGSRLRFQFFLIGVFVLAIFYSIWYLAGWSVPSLNKINLIEDAVWILPFSFSRWWDVIFAPAMLVFFFWIWGRHSKLESGDQPVFDIGLALGFLLNVAFIALYNLQFSLAFWLVFYWGIGFVLSCLLTITENRHQGFVFGLGYCLVFGGFGSGCVFGFIFTPIFIAVSLLVCLGGIIFGLALKLGVWVWYKRIDGRNLLFWDW